MVKLNTCSTLSVLYYMIRIVTYMYRYVMHYLLQKQTFDCFLLNIAKSKKALSYSYKMKKTNINLYIDFNSSSHQHVQIILQA